MIHPDGITLQQQVLGLSQGWHVQWSVVHGL